MFTRTARTLVERAKALALTVGQRELTLGNIAAVLANDDRAAPLLAACLRVEPTVLATAFPALPDLLPVQRTMALAEDVRVMLACAKSLAEKAPSATHPGLVATPHLVAATATSIPPALVGLHDSPACEALLPLVAKWLEEEHRPPSLGELTARMRALRQLLLGRVFGQERAVHDLVDGLFNVEVVGRADSDRRSPSGVFVFAGPPGVGKTYLAELTAEQADRPYCRFDMSTYAHSHEASVLVGVPRMYQGAQPGRLTDFVKQHPTAVLLFDEIEKAHHTAIQLFLQILDAGRLEDKFTGESVSFRDTVIVFTTNVGRKLYENENSAGIHRENAAFHRRTILDALRTEIDPHTRAPFFPAAICSRMATGYPILFNHLGADDLARVARTEIDRVGKLLERQHGQRYVVADEVPLAVVMREGARTDARTVKGQAGALLREEVFKACRLFADARIDAVFGDIREVALELDVDEPVAVVQQVFGAQARPCVLLAGDPLAGEWCRHAVPDVEWVLTANADQVFDALAKTQVDFLLLDLALPQHSSLPDAPLLDAAFHDVSLLVDRGRTGLEFDHEPLSARRFGVGQRLLEQLHDRLPDVPVYLWSVDADRSGLGGARVDEELLLACVRAGGARGAIHLEIGQHGGAGPVPAEAAAALLQQITAVTRRLRKERLAAELGRKSQVLAFDTAPALRPDGTGLTVRCRNLRLVRAPQSDDVGSLVSDVERPSTRFDQVFGAQAAKEAMLFLRDWLKDPKMFLAAGVEPPRGVLLTGAPGTGKTMLARALAGESECAFVAAAATAFVTRFQGSGPEAIRELFARARRYAPSVVFIDEIDAVGADRGDVRTGFVGHGEAMALNQLLVEMDGFGHNPARPVIVIAATNHPEKLDPALIRRFGRTVEVERPTRSERDAYMTARLTAKARHQVARETVERLAAQSQGLSVADLERIFAEASVMAVANSGVITDAILSEAFEKVTLGAARHAADPWRTARHEAGHAVVMCATGTPPVFVTIVGRGSLGGYAAFDAQEEPRALTKREHEDRICQLLAGHAAERRCYAGADGFSTGPSNDLERATALATAMVCDYGMSEDVGLVRIDRRVPMDPDLARRVHLAVRRILDEQEARASSLIHRHGAGFDRMVEALVLRNRLERREILELLDADGEAGAAGESAP